MLLVQENNEIPGLVPPWLIIVSASVVTAVVLCLAFGSKIYQELDHIGSFLAGTTSLVVWMWFVAAYLVQSKELRLQRKEIKLQRESLDLQREEMKKMALFSSVEQIINIMSTYESGLCKWSSVYMNLTIYSLPSKLQGIFKRWERNYDYETREVFRSEEILVNEFMLLTDAVRFCQLFNFCTNLFAEASGRGVALDFNMNINDNNPGQFLMTYYHSYVHIQQVVRDHKKVIDLISTILQVPTVSLNNTMLPVELQIFGPTGS